jgi:Fe2+ or Zn2+ uptake regulation protein
METLQLRDLSVKKQQLAKRALTKLKEAGGRLTEPRKEIVAVLVESESHKSADDIALRIREVNPKIHLTTVYRTLDTLEKLGVVSHVHLGHGRAIYHLTDDSHYHLYCQECGSTTEIPPELFDKVTETIRSQWSFEPKFNHFAVIGTCASCAKTAIARDRTGIDR